MCLKKGLVGCKAMKMNRSLLLCLLQFKDPYESYLRQHSQDGDACGPFGLEYTFTLRETELNKNAVDEVPEWMLPLDALKVRRRDGAVLGFACMHACV